MAGASMKVIDKEFRHYGASRRRERYGTTYTFPDGAVKFVNETVSRATAADLLAWVQRRYKPARDVLGGVEAHTPPVIDPNRIVLTDHARHRITLMENQAGRLRRRELADALLHPDRVRWSPEHGSWMWVGERIAVTAHVTDGVTTIRTVLWATADLWDENPRPKGKQQ